MDDGRRTTDGVSGWLGSVSDGLEVLVVPGLAVGDEALLEVGTLG